MSTDHASPEEQSAGEIIAALQRRWILEGWEKAPGERFVFKDKVGQFYDWEATGATYYDTFDPQLRIARSPAEWRDAFEKPFDAMHSALHAVTDEPDVLVRGEMAAATFEFCARLQAKDGKVTSTICRTSHVWGLRDGEWRIIREHTSCRLVPLEELEGLLRKHEPQKL